MIPRSALWQVLEKIGVSPAMLQIIKSFYDGMRADVRMGAISTDIYYSAVVSNWRGKCPSAGVSMRFKHGRKLVGDCTAKSNLSLVKVTEFQFADDTATYGTSRDDFEYSAREL